MDVTEKKIVDGLRLIAKRYGSGGALSAVVKSVDTETFTCEVVTDDERHLPDVMYKSTTVGVDIIFQPAIDSTVMIEKMADDEEYFIVVFGAVDKVIFKIGETVFELSESGITFNGGSLGGLVKVESLVERLNALEGDLTSLKTAFNSWIVVPTDGGAALKAAAAAWAGSTITTTQVTDLENDKIKQ